VHLFVKQIGDFLSIKRWIIPLTVAFLVANQFLVSESENIYFVMILVMTSANIDRFLKFFH